jgi:hypothetical protein
MLEQHLKSPVTRQRLRSGPAADHIDGFADWLHRHRYSPITIDTTLRSLAGWTDWMRAAGFTEHDMLAGFASCSAELQTHRRVRYGRGPNDHSLAAAALFIRFLREQGVLPPPAAPPSPADLWPVIGEFRSWMRLHRGLTETTLDVYQAIFVELLATRGSTHISTLRRSCATSFWSERVVTGSRVRRPSLSRFVLCCAFSAPRDGVRRECSTPSPALPPGSSQRFLGSWLRRMWSG